MLLNGLKSYYNHIYLLETIILQVNKLILKFSCIIKINDLPKISHLKTMSKIYIYVEQKQI